MTRERAADWVLRLGVAFAFLYPPWSALQDPNSWLGYFPKFMHDIVPDILLLHGFGVIEVILALWILSGWKIFWPCLAATAILLAIVVSDLSSFQILFRDLALAAIPLALAIVHAPRSLILAK